MLRTAAKFTLGALAGLLLWWYLAPAYGSMLAWTATRILRVDSRIHDLRPVEKGRWIFLESESLTAPSATIPADQLTYNVALFLGLVAASERQLFRKRKLGAFAIGTLLLAVSHVVTFVFSIESTYAVSEPFGSRYGVVESNIWFFGIMFLRLVGMMALAFACWIFVRTHGEE
jgi:hypothetical protein